MCNHRAERKKSIFFSTSILSAATKRQSRCTMSRIHNHRRSHIHVLIHSSHERLNETHNSFSLLASSNVCMCVCVFSIQFKTATHLQKHTADHLRVRQILLFSFSDNLKKKRILVLFIFCPMRYFRKCENVIGKQSLSFSVAIHVIFIVNSQRK